MPVLWRASDVVDNHEKTVSISCFVCDAQTKEVKWCAEPGCEDDGYVYECYTRECAIEMAARLWNMRRDCSLEHEMLQLVSELVEFAREASLPPYHDSDLAGLLGYLRHRAKALLEKYELEKKGE